MLFHIEHTTEYVYSEPAIEAFSEVRLRPRDSLSQKVSRHTNRVDPPVVPESYLDYFGNYVEALSVPFRHERLAVTSMCDVVTHPPGDPLSGLDLTLSEARQVYGSRRRELYEFLRPSRFIPFDERLRQLAGRLLPPTANLAVALKELNHHIFSDYTYRAGTTDAATQVAEFLKLREGVCQDFAHLMIAICRNAGLPARYVSGYIESNAPAGDVSGQADSHLIGAAASHAWVAVYLPNHFWVGLDPTNDMMEGERHVQVGIGRDYHDVTPLKGVFKGSNKQTLSVQVRVSRARDPRGARQAGG